jgi:hypothetical protein
LQSSANQRQDQEIHEENEDSSLLMLQFFLLNNVFLMLKQAIVQLDGVHLKKESLQKNLKGRRFDIPQELYLWLIIGN